MTNTFKVGDKVRCIEPGWSNSLRVPGAYTVTKVDDDTVYVRDANGLVTGGWYTRRFERIEDEDHGEGQYILIVENSDGKLAPALKPRVYKTAALAKRVANDMALRNRGEKFYIFKAVGEAQAPLVQPSIVNMY
jgi:hypothetical protein